MEYPVAVICESDTSFKAFMYAFLKNTDITFYKITNRNQARGVTFSGYIMLPDSQKLQDLDGILYTVKSRIRT